MSRRVYYGAGTATEPARMPLPLNAFALPRLGAGWMLVAGGLLGVWFFGERLDTAGVGVGLIVLAGVASVMAGRRSG